jgi:hypothetical protein
MTKTYDVIRGDGRTVKVTVPAREEQADETYCEVCEVEDEPLTVPTPGWPFRVCRDCADAWDEMQADDPLGADFTVDLAEIRRFGATAFDLRGQG